MSGLRGAARLGLTLLLLPLACESEPTASDPEAGLEAESASLSEPHTAALERLRGFEAEARASTDFSALPSSDGRFGSDPYRLLALPGERVAVLLRGDDRLLITTREGKALGSLATPHDPTDMAVHGAELLVVGTGAAQVARYSLDAGDGVPSGVQARGTIDLPDALAPRAIAADAERVYIADEGHGRLHELREGAAGLELHASHDYCRGPLALARVDGWLIANCLLEHRLRVDRIGEQGFEAGAEAGSGPTHDGPIWSFEVGPPDARGHRLVASTGVEDHPLERRDGGFGYIDSFVFIDELSRRDDGSASFERRASVNVSELGVVTPKWSRWLESNGESASLVLAGYASEGLLELHFDRAFEAAARVVTRPGLPGTRDAIVLAEDALLAVTPLLDGLLRLDTLEVELVPVASETEDTRSFEHRLGEALVFTTAMAPWNSAEDKRSRFTCETCHFEGRGDGRVHFTGREFEGQPVHASSKALLGLFPNRPHFSRALDRRMATMVDNEFGVANRHSGREPWFELSKTDLPWLAQLPGWPERGSVDGEGLRRALMTFLMRWSMPQNPATRDREQFDALEARGGSLFARHCESCHQARLVSDDPSSRVALGEGDSLEPWRALIFADNGPLVWASDAYVQTGIRPWVHAQGARVPALRRLYLKWPYFTNGRAASLDEVLVGIRLRAEGCDHELGPGPEGEQLSLEEREALRAFLTLL